MSWISLTVKDIALGAGPHVMWWLLEGIEPSFDACLSPGGGFRRAAEEKNGRKNDHLEPLGRVHFGSEGGAPNGNMASCLGGGLKVLELQLHSN